MPEQHGFIAELGRRHVWRAAVLYIGAAWALAQGIAQLGPSVGAPGWVVRWFLIAAAIGFPFWIAFAWFFAWTPQGLKREGDVERTPSLARATGRKLDIWIIAVLAVAVALLASGYFVRRHAPVAASAAAKPFNPPSDTIVVLPFANLGGDPKKQYFSDGITEELTNALGQDTALRVIAWDTASKYRNSTQSAGDIGRALDVANVLTGKILRQGNAIRVIVELVNARTGFQAWSHHYDDSLANIFKVQDRISAAIAGALKVKFAAAAARRTVNPRAYDLVQKARAIVNSGLGEAAPLQQARMLLQQAVALDPDYAGAHGLLARTWSDLIGAPGVSLEDGTSKAREEAGKTLSLDPRNVDAMIALGNAAASAGDYAKASTEYQRALAIDPSNAGAHLDYGNMLPYKQGLVQYLKALQLDPQNASAQSNVALIYMDLHEYRKELPASLALVKLAPHNPAAAMSLAQNYALLHRDEDAVAAFDAVRPESALDKALVAAGRLAYQSRIDPGVRAPARATADALYRRHDLDAVAQYVLMKIYLLLGAKDRALDLLASYCKSAAYGCNDFFENPTYDPLRDDPRFKALSAKYGNLPAPPASAAMNHPGDGGPH